MKTWLQSSNRSRYIAFQFLLPFFSYHLNDAEYFLQWHCKKCFPVVKCHLIEINNDLTHFVSTYTRKFKRKIRLSCSNRFNKKTFQSQHSESNFIFRIKKIVQFGRIFRFWVAQTTAQNNPNGQDLCKVKDKHTFKVAIQ